MTIDITNELDAALTRLLAGEPVSAILAGDPTQAQVLSLLLDTVVMLETLRPLELPAPAALQADRNQFLAQVAALPQPAVSPGPLDRLKEWIVHSLPWPTFNFTYHRKEQWQMSTLLVKAVIIFGLVFGSVGGTAVMAAQSLPDSPVYPLKLTMEQARLSLTSDPVKQAEQYLNMAQARTQEMMQVALKGDVPAEAAQTRLLQHLRQALQLAAQTPAEQMPGLLDQARQMAQTQTQELAQIQAQVGAPAQAALQQANRLLNQFGQAVGAGLQDPQSFRRQYQPGQAAETFPPVDQPGPGEPGGNPDCPSGDCEPAGDEYRHRYGPGEAQPGQHGEPDGDANHYGRTSDTLPGPHGECDSGDCEPAGDQNQYISEPVDQPGPGEPGGNPDCPSGDCEPVGDEYQHQYGAGEAQPGQHGEPCQTGTCEPDGDANHYGQATPEPGDPHGDQDCTNDCQPAGDQNQNGASDSDQDGGADDSGGDNGGSDNGGSDSDASGDGDNGDSGGDDNGDSGGGSDNGGDNGGGGGKH
ncbi:MAG: DUF5667 domain-containing protein [Chloroflexota bacterium]